MHAHNATVPKWYIPYQGERHIQIFLICNDHHIAWTSMDYFQSVNDNQTKGNAYIYFFLFELQTQLWWDDVSSSRLTTVSPHS